MSEELPFGIGEDDIVSFRKRQSAGNIDNHPLRNTETTSFFGALMSEDADFIKHGFVSEDIASLLNIGEEGK